ncbi:LysE family transporter [Dictyobacter aurantiacus]|uniref:Chemotactic transduction protein ChpE n=1 Tax=Dictyobacter aurantiacus TaxID=1936993 RepID=A0A401ZHB6_9CHLR|nr:LysE family transporter [Dictyobacter aurantiacus]GCE06088.1 chemotactic transduction protein ChpE [Dictyobacter aurantiacus]
MSLFLSAFGLGLAFFAAPGAITAQLLRRGLKRGFFSALFLQLGALIGVTLWALIAFIGAAMLAQNTPVRLFLGILGILLLLLLAWQALRDAYRGQLTEAKDTSAHGDFVLGAALSLANPLPIAFWLGIGNTIVSSNGRATPDPWSLEVFLTGFLCSALLWCFFMSGLIAWGRRFVTPLFFRLVNFVCGLALVFFALKLCWILLSLLMS